ncbi:LysR family transcriptional regulator [Acinetobacter qingfengensis]|uniref:HTH lysR-type domain-containing protein n=1 Tax=Acinetobacter qingfengensis TaxID=1262585 RepID=A0A1E7R9F8_9GAMM|nr:LysR family transcriptional regulator [Acinetobacter qingfengensis]KAA8735427.1 LysR family transcriptional regulator [Acinetobacter qingfengensis]OEY95925.1 hypothetical protein BJI46_03145 [Acinetobacter qingfengensis]
MNLNQELLTVFKTSIDTGSFSATARQLKKAPSAISMAISQLEDELNLKLFDRSKREPQPTAAALSLYQSTLHTLATMQQWQNHALQLSNQVEPMLSIAIATELESLTWITIFTQLSEIYPLLELEILTLPQEEAYEAVLSGRIHFAILLERHHLNEHEQFIEIGKENMLAVVAGHHPLAVDHVDYDALLKHRQIIFNNRETVHSSLLKISYQSWQTDNQYFAEDIIKAGLAWGFLPQSYIQQDLDTGLLKIIDIADFNPKISLCIDLLWSREHPIGKVAQSFIDLIKAQKHR